MLWFRECPRCEGDLVALLDIYGLYIACLQCGYHLTVEEERRLRAGGPAREREVVAA
ncbi:MAG: hypothetical protein HY683_10875 [Chloroflexi bacterium]|nr:hypothetical protein [Chloroflexota bacterium]